MTHTWAAVVLVAADVLHLIIHWRWVTKVTTKMFIGIVTIPRRWAASSPTSSFPAQPKAFWEDLLHNLANERSTRARQ
ncbi:MAG: hypothetical protein GY759_03025 [Chloroflexi bacterium]|nr:hypothetical protein [Chloroflexota bacterium]